MSEETIERHCFAVLVTNEPGVLARVVGLFSGRGYNIESLTVDEVDAEANCSRMTIVTRGTRAIIDQIGAQLSRLVPVREVVDLSKSGAFAESCSAFIKVLGDQAAHDKAKVIAQNYTARVAAETGKALIFEIAAAPQTIDRFSAELRKLGRLEIARSGSVAIGCGESMLGDTVALAQRQSA